ncbi:hypothetical protein CCR75_009421 [Bremia lactucae]|uniref:Uncharacterized protein n=1 Tax=Bremia lactucae TaxID=4779 RepID=A0A976FH65_BRELC|nr:hypothetical protein CCR75_009421 [Bremia lactucae]
MMVIVPLWGARTSTLTLSVSNTTTTSSSATASPGCFNPFYDSSSEIKSPMEGTRTSAREPGKL